MATIDNPAYHGVDIYEDNGDGTGAMHVIVDSGGANTVSTSTEVIVTSAAVDTELLPANPDRKGGSIFNAADKILYVKYGTGASPTSYKTQIAPGGFWAFPLPIYTGVINGIWEAAPTGDAIISEEE